MKDNYLACGHHASKNNDGSNKKIKKYNTINGWLPTSDTLPEIVLHVLKSDLPARAAAQAHVVVVRGAPAAVSAGAAIRIRYRQDNTH